MKRNIITIYVAILVFSILVGQDFVVAQVNSCSECDSRFVNASGDKIRKLTVKKDLRVKRDLFVDGIARISGGGQISGNVFMLGTAQISGNASMKSDANITGNINVTGTASKTGGGEWAVLSDERLKTIYGTFDRGLEEISKLQPIIYRYNKNNPLNVPDLGEYIGFSAQEVQKVIPEAVSENSKGYLMVNNDPIKWAMLNAIKEQQTQIEQLKTENVELRDKLTTLADKHEAIVDMLLALSTYLPKEKLVKLDKSNIDKVQKTIQ